MLSKKFLIAVLGVLVFANTSFALNLSRVKEWSNNEVLTANDLNNEFDNIVDHPIVNADIGAGAGIVASKLDLTVGTAIGSVTPSTGAFTTLSSTGTTTIGDAAADTLQVNANTIIFEGATADTVETTLTITDPTSSDKTVTIPNANSVTLPTGAAFFMMTGSCPPGTTDVSASYSNKFIKINATAGTSSGVVLTGTTDSHTLQVSEMPAHTHTTVSRSSRGTNAGTENYAGSSLVSNDTTSITSSTGGDGGHTHTFSTASTLEPSSITAKLCQVD